MVIAVVQLAINGASHRGVDWYVIVSQLSVNLYLCSWRKSGGMLASCPACRWIIVRCQNVGASTIDWLFLKHSLTSKHYFVGKVTTKFCLLYCFFAVVVDLSC